MAAKYGPQTPGIKIGSELLAMVQALRPPISSGLHSVAETASRTLAQTARQMSPAGFIGSPRMNFLEVTVASVCGERVTIQSPTVSPVTVEASGFAAGDRAVLGVRPQYLRAHGDESLTGSLRGTIRHIERLGSETIVSLETVSNERTLAAIPHDEVFVPGSEIEFRFDPDAAHLFPAN